MDVTGISTTKAQEILDASIQTGSIDEAGNLVLQNGAGTEFNAGVVIEPFRSWPVGSVFITISPDNPAVALGGGTWERFAKGRTLVSLDEAQTEFDTVQETGGEKTHLLTAAELPPHTHEYLNWDQLAMAQGGSTQNYAAAWSVANTTEGLIGGGNPPGNQPHNNLQPYINVYMWLRTA